LLQASLDDKGRLKVPVDAVKFFKDLAITKLFVTSTDGQLARIYPIELWRHNVSVIQNSRQNVESGKRLMFFARANGGEAEIDDAGRLLLPAKLRELLKLDRQPVWLEFHNGAVTLLTKKDYDARMGVSQAYLASDLSALETEGFV